MSILVGSTIPAFAMNAPEPHWHHWLENAKRISNATTEATGHQVEWLAVIQTDKWGDGPFARLLIRLRDLRNQDLIAGVWRFSIDTGEAEVSSGSRLAAICTGRNLIIERALRGGHDFIYFADSDISAPDDVLVRLLAVDHPVVGAHVPTYCLDGSPRDYPGMDVREHWNTAGSLLIAREAFRRVPWRYDPDAGLTDDPATQTELARLGYPTLVRHDVVCRHNPECIGPLEHRGLDLTVYR